MTEGPTRPALVGTVFPATSARTRTAFAAALAVIALLMLALAALKWQAPLLGLVGLGLPLLFVLYLWDADVLRRRLGAVLFAVIVGIVLGIGWETCNEWVVALNGPDALGTPASPTRFLIVHVALPLSYAALLSVPVIVTRPRGSVDRNPLTGFQIGALGAYCFAAAATLTGLASEFDDGLRAEANRAASELAAAAAIEGLAIPLIAAAVGGSVGAALWRTPTVGVARPRWFHLASPVPTLAFGAFVYLVLDVLDSTTGTWVADMVGYAAVTVAALYVQHRVLRATLQVQSDHPRFRERRPRTILLIATSTAVAVAAASAGLSLWLTPPAPNYVCPPDCGRPPLRQPVTTNPRFTPPSGEFSVSYPGEGTAYTAEFEPNGVVLTLLAGEGGSLHLYGEPAAGRTARQVVEDEIAAAHPDARVEYEIPNPLVGYQLGYGVVADVYPAQSVGDNSRLRILVMAAVKNDYALIAAGAGPYREFSPDFGSGHPSGANFLLSLDMGKYVNSFAWRGDPPR